MAARNEVKAARQALTRHSLGAVRPICSTAENQFRDEEVLAVFFYAAGLMGARLDAQALSVKIDRLHRHGSSLYAVVNEDLTPEEIDNLQQAWEEVAGARREDVHVLAENSSLWADIWKKRARTMAPQQAG